MSPSPVQLLIVALIVLVLFGASRLGDLGKGLGEGIRNFKKGISDDDAAKKLSSDQSKPPADEEKSE
jgi:sec-independent protein translocase protein TatA